MTPPAEQQPLSRRQLRELQRTGQIPTSPAAEAPEDSNVSQAASTESESPLSGQEIDSSDGDIADGAVSRSDRGETPYAKVAPTDEVIETAEIVSPLPAPTSQGSEVIVPVIPTNGVPLTRRQARELERARTASITVVPAGAGATPGETGEIVTAEPIDSTGAHAPVTEEKPDTELEVVEHNASETGDLTEVVIDAESTADDADSGDHGQSVTVADGFGEAALTTDTDPLAEEEAFDTLIATGIADAESDRTPTTSSTLILGSPMATFTGPIGGTGEIMVTGSIDLPRTMSGTADPDTHDRADYDRSLDHEPPAPPTAGTPVSASRAVSTHTSARDIIAPPARSKKPSIVPILAITAGVLMVAVIAVIVTSLLTGAL
ncbi:hypothetical protein ELQ90_07255 [Labedella phragmitis]|uniref:Uncharacterized protein n=1 Tax=Labedella phragmitis TaxID=2498849 RepID=A0A3S3Z9L9_9MICO|nr:hypothetical protein [Labedella phragmitis]RWZ51875.1 hypothetical protein ELQ90_07255 [Labedella phragmitis]